MGSPLTKPEYVTVTTTSTAQPTSTVQQNYSAPFENYNQGQGANVYSHSLQTTEPQQQQPTTINVYKSPPTDSYPPGTVILDYPVGCPPPPPPPTNTCSPPVEYVVECVSPAPAPTPVIKRACRPAPVTYAPVYQVQAPAPRQCQVQVQPAPVQVTTRCEENTYAMEQAQGLAGDLIQAMRQRVTSYVGNQGNSGSCAPQSPPPPPPPPPQPQQQQQQQPVILIGIPQMASPPQPPAPAAAPVACTPAPVPQYLTYSPVQVAPVLAYPQPIARGVRRPPPLQVLGY